jgi:hypothetical protein
VNSDALLTDAVGDQPSQSARPPATIGAPNGAAERLELEHRSPPLLSGDTAAFRCHRCPTTTHFVAHLGWEPRWRTRRRGSS